MNEGSASAPSLPATTPASLDLPGGRRQIHLTGFMGAGKSTIGRLLARRLLWNFLDLDGIIERQERRSVARIFAERGEETFRELERAVLRQVVLKPGTVVALGGGTLIDGRNRALCAEKAVVVWLEAPLEILQVRCAAAGEGETTAPVEQGGGATGGGQGARVAGSAPRGTAAGTEEAEKRPLWGNAESLRARYAERLPGYEAASITVDATAEPERVVDGIIDALARR